MKAVRVIAPDAENRGSAIKESDPNNTRAVVLRRFRVPAIGSTFNGASVTEPLIIDETNSAAPVPLACSVPAPSPGPGGV
jgi:hypothetical protein